MGRIKTGLNLDQLFSNQEESDTKTCVTSHSRNVSVKMLVDSDKIETAVKDPLQIECIACEIKIISSLGPASNN